MPNWSDDEGRSWFCLCGRGGPDCPRCNGNFDALGYNYVDIQKHRQLKNNGATPHVLLRQYDSDKPRRRLTTAVKEKTIYSKGDDMKIKKVTYQRVSNLGGYETERLEAEADVAANEKPEAVAESLKKWVHGQLGIDDEMTEEQYQKAKRNVERYERRR